LVQRVGASLRARPLLAAPNVALSLFPNATVATAFSLRLQIHAHAYAVTDSLVVLLM